MIKLLKDHKSEKVLGLVVNGKKYNLSRDICHALYIAEKSASNLALREKKRLTEASADLEHRSYIGESKNLKIMLSFDGAFKINSSMSRVEFKTEMPPDDKKSILKHLNEFLEAFNMASQRRERDISLEIEKITKKVA